MYHTSSFYYYQSMTVLQWNIPQLLKEIRWLSPVHLSSGHWKCNSHSPPYALLSGRKIHLVWCALKAAIPRYFATLLPFPLVRRSNYQHGSRLGAAQNGQAERQTSYFCCHRSFHSGEFFHWTETQEPFHLRRHHQEEEFLVQAKFLKVITILNTELYSKKYTFKVER